MDNLEFNFSKKKLIKTFLLNILLFVILMALVSALAINKSKIRTGQELTKEEFVIYCIASFILSIVLSAAYSFIKHRRSNTKIEFINDNIYFHSKSREKRGFNTNEIKAIRVRNGKMEFMIGDLMHTYSLDAMSVDDIEKIKVNVERIQNNLTIRNS